MAVLHLKHPIGIVFKFPLDEHDDTMGIKDAGMYQASTIQLQRSCTLIWKLMSYLRTHLEQ